jgi:hypothetical protein
MYIGKFKLGGVTLRMRRRIGSIFARENPTFQLTEKNMARLVVGDVLEPSLICSPYV